MDIAPPPHALSADLDELTSALCGAMFASLPRASHRTVAERYVRALVNPPRRATFRALGGHDTALAQRFHHFLTRSSWSCAGLQDGLVDWLCEHGHAGVLVVAAARRHEPAVWVSSRTSALAAPVAWRPETAPAQGPSQGSVAVAARLTGARGGLPLVAHVEPGDLRGALRAAERHRQTALFRVPLPRLRRLLEQGPATTHADRRALELVSSPVVRRAAGTPLGPAWSAVRQPGVRLPGRSDPTTVTLHLFMSEDYGTDDEAWLTTSAELSPVCVHDLVMRAHQVLQHPALPGARPFPGEDRRRREVWERHMTLVSAAHVLRHFANAR